MRVLLGFLMVVMLAACGTSATGSSVSLGGDGAAGQDASTVASPPATVDQSADGSMAMCIEGVPDCNDMVVTTEPPLDDSCTVSSDGETLCPDGTDGFDPDCAVSSDGEMTCPASPGGSAGAGSSPGSAGTGEILCEGNKPTAAAPAGTDCSAPPEPEGREVTPKPEGLTGVHKIAWERYTADGRNLTVHWATGVEPCSVLHSVTVVEDAERIRVTLREGSADPNAACVMIAEYVKTTVRLDQPVGDRKVVDGAE